MKNQQNSQLKKAYLKKIKHFNYKLFEQPNAGLKLFIEHLKYLRDSLIINIQNDVSRKTLTSDLIILMNTIEEFEAFEKSKDSKQKYFHWKNFCECLKLSNIGDIST